MAASSGNRRVLVWNEIPKINGAPADLVLGWKHMSTRGENGPARGLSVAARAGFVFVADAGNNRVMAWRGWPEAHGALRDFLHGPTDVMPLDHNRGAYYPTAGAVNMPYELCVQDDRLILADAANSHLLGFDLDDVRMGASAWRLAGQGDFTQKGDNRWVPAARDNLRWPYGVAACGSSLAMADSGNNRVLLWEASP